MSAVSPKSDAPTVIFDTENKQKRAERKTPPCPGRVIRISITSLVSGHENFENMDSSYYILTNDIRTHVKTVNFLVIQVDVLFEEDKGFWVSVNTLRQNSKRPIVMTASGNAFK